MNPVVTIGGKLALICAVAALLLGAANALTEPQIAKIKAERLQLALAAVSGGAAIGDPVPVENGGSVERYYPVLTGAGEIQGYVCRLIGGGYGGDMIILGGYDTDGTILSVKMMENLETPGLGKEAEKDYYMEKFLGTGGASKVPVRKDMLELADSDAITGATVTFIGIGKALQDGSDFVRKLGEN